MKTAIIIGAGPAGLACAAMLKREGIAVTIVEKGSQICPVWHNHYDRLHLHSDKPHSSLPDHPMPAAFPKYPSRSQVIEYCEDYARHFDLEPILHCVVKSVSRKDQWHVDTSCGPMSADMIVFATGMASFPNRAHWPGLDAFSGEVLHSSEYRNPTRFADKRVLVVGFGNSGGEIGLDLANAGIELRLSVRGPVNIVPRELFGIPILTISILQQYLPYKIADLVNKPVLRLALGNTKKLGLQAPAKGSMAQVVEDGKIPVLDIGTLKAMREGAIQLRAGIDRIEGSAVTFVDGSQEDFDAMILATGFRPDLRPLLPGMGHLLDETGLPKQCGANSGQEGLYFCSYRPSATGQLRQIGIEAKEIAAAAAAAARAAAQ